MDLIFETLFNKITSPSFGKELGGELPLYIQPIPSEQQFESESQIHRLSARLTKKGFRVSIVDLYDLTMQVLREGDILDAILENESNIDRSDIVATLDSVIDIQENIIPRIKDRVESENPDFLLFTGVGHVYPFVRSHGILNNLDDLAKKTKIILFFPGDYNNLQLSLFCRIFDENYYRAHNLNDIRESQ